MSMTMQAYQYYATDPHTHLCLAARTVIRSSPADMRSYSHQTISAPLGSVQIVKIRSVMEIVFEKHIINK
jgi:hypothetical protein